MNTFISILGITFIYFVAKSALHIALSPSKQKGKLNMTLAFCTTEFLPMYIVMFLTFYLF